MLKSRYLTTLALTALLTSVSLVSISQAQVHLADLAERDGLLYRGDAQTPYTGPVEDPSEQMTGAVRNGLRQGDWMWSYPSGEPEHLMAYEDGEVVRMEGWHENGQRSSLWPYEDGAPHGATRSWDHNGTLRQERVWDHGRPNGAYRVWDHNGALLYSAEFVDGALDGPAIWWYPDGSKRWETAYANGQRQGTWSQYAADGELRMRSEWENGALVDRMDNPYGSR